MSKITFLGAGSTVFAKNVICDSMLMESLQDSEIALYDIDKKRLAESMQLLSALNQNINKGRAGIKIYCGGIRRKAALKGADFVINAIQVGGYEPCTVTDFEIPKKFGLRQTIGDTIGIGGLFRALRTIPILLEIAHEMEEVCPDALLMNYTNPQASIVGALCRGTSIQNVGLCHSVQICAEWLLECLGMSDEVDMQQVHYNIAGINHMAWLLEIYEGKKDLYPEIKRRAAKKLAEARKQGAEKFDDMVRYHMMENFGYYITESSEHNAEYHPYWIKSQFPGLIEEFNIPLDEYPRRCMQQINDWEKDSHELIHKKDITHTKSCEYAADIMNAIVTDQSFRIHGNVVNHGIISNLPSNAVVEVACLVDRNGIQPTYFGSLPEQCAALNRTNINTQLLTVEASLTGKRDCVYQAAMLDPHTASELPLDTIKELCDALIEAQGDWLPKFT